MQRPWLFPLLAPLLVFGCASPGPPRPPSLHLPENATGLAAERVGDQVHISWTSPVNTTDGDRIKGATTAVLCRELPPDHACSPVQRVAVVAGPSRLEDALSATLAAGPPRLLAYRVELLNAKGRSAGKSAAVFAVGGEAPPAVGPLTLSASRNAVLVRWEQLAPRGVPVLAGSTVMELKRSLVGPDVSGPATAGKTKAKARDGGRRVQPKDASGTVVLRGAQVADVVPASASAGLLDATAISGNTYRYVAQRITSVTLSGHPLELRGEPSPPATFLFRDVLPPQAPTGLVSVPGMGFGSPLSVDLSWEPSAEADVLGYNVYRRSGQSGFVRMTDEPVTGPAFRDLKITAGNTYTYRVTAVDQRKNESRPSNEVQETPRP